MASIEDRRRISMRLSVLQYAIVVRVLGAGRELLGPAGRPSRQVRRDGGEQPPADAGAARAARPGVRSRRPGAGGEPALVQHLDRPRAHQGYQPHGPPAGQGPRRRRSARARNRRSAPPRAVVPADHHRAGRDARAGRRRHGAAARLRAARRRRRAGADAAVSGGDGRASVRLRGRGQRRAGRRATAA